MQRLPSRGLTSPVRRYSAAFGPSIAKIGSNNDRSITWPAPSPTSTAAQRGQGGGRAIETGEGVGHGEGRQDRRPVGKPIHRGKAAHRLDQRAEARLVAIGTGLTPARDPDHHQLRIAPEQHVRAEPHALERARPEILDQHLRGLDQRQQQLAAGGERADRGSRSSCCGSRPATTGRHPRSASCADRRPGQVFRS